MSEPTPGIAATVTVTHPDRELTDAEKAHLGLEVTE
jgi:hypothetical protein